MCGIRPLQQFKYPVQAIEDIFPFRPCFFQFVAQMSIGFYQARNVLRLELLIGKVGQFLSARSLLIQIVSHVIDLSRFPGKHGKVHLHGMILPRRLQRGAGCSRARIRSRYLSNKIVVRPDECARHRGSRPLVIGCDPCNSGRHVLLVVVRRFVSTLPCKLSKRRRIQTYINQLGERDPPEPRCDEPCAAYPRVSLHFPGRHHNHQASASHAMQSAMADISTISLALHPLERSCAGLLNP